jgi:hypothetical protein
VAELLRGVAPRTRSGRYRAWSMLPALSGAEVAHALGMAGAVRIEPLNADTISMERRGRQVHIPDAAVIDPDTLVNVLEDAGIDIVAFLAMLDEASLRAGA